MKIVVTAGPTREYLDPVRFLSNPSTGKMGFAVAAEAARRGHDVTLIAGPVSIKTPKGVRRVDVVSAREMLAAVEHSLSDAMRPSRPRVPTAFISTAAVADWRPAKCATSKLKKHQMSGMLKLVRNPDILKTLARLKKSKSKGEVEGRTNLSCAAGWNNITSIHRSSTFDFDSLLLVGFAAETGNVLSEASRKCREKGLSFIVANDVTEKGSGFGTDTNRVTFVFPDGTLKRHPLMSKRCVAGAIIREIEGLKE